MLLLTVTTRASRVSRRRSSSNPVRAKWPRWFVPSCISKPSAVVALGTAITPALLISRSSCSLRACRRSPKSRTDARLARSSSSTSRSAPGAFDRIVSAASSPFAVLRHATITRAPARASSRAVARPRPLFAPVTTARRPAWSGIRSAVHFTASASLRGGSAVDGVQQGPHLAHAQVLLQVARGLLAGGAVDGHRQRDQARSTLVGRDGRLPVRARFGRRRHARAELGQIGREPVGLGAQLVQIPVDGGRLGAQPRQRVAHHRGDLLLRPRGGIAASLLGLADQRVPERLRLAGRTVPDRARGGLRRAEHLAHLARELVRQRRRSVPVRMAVRPIRSVLRARKPALPGVSAMGGGVPSLCSHPCVLPPDGERESTTRPTAPVAPKLGVACVPMLDVVRVRQRTNPPVHARELEDVVLKDDEGRDVRLGDLWRDRPVALSFLRHYGCVFCRDQAVQLHRARKAFEAAGVGVAVVGFGTPADAAEFRRLQGVDLQLLVDSPERRTYVLAGAKVATFGELLGPKVAWQATKRTLLSRLRLGSIAVHQGKIRHHAAQLGGVLLIAPDGSVRYSYLSEDAGDNPPLREVLAAARAIRPRVKAPSGPEAAASPVVAASRERSAARA